jgi:DNA-binding transcriptional LysR family regulator
MKLTLRQLRYLVAVADQGSIAAAARVCHISQSSILAAMAQAEGAMSARLFDKRPARGVIPTPAGDRFIASARRFLAAESDFSRTIQGQANGMPAVLRIGCFAPFGALFMPDLLRRFMAGSETEVHLMEGEQTQLLAWLESGTVDAVVTYDVGTPLPADRTELAQVPPHALLSADDPLAAKPAVSLAELAERPLVLLDLPQTSSYLTSLFDAAGVRPRVAFRTRNYDTVRAAVANGFGMSILNMRPFGHGSPDSPSLIRRPLRDPVGALRLIVADKYGQEKPAFLRRFIGTVQTYFDHIGPQGYALAWSGR